MALYRLRESAMMAPMGNEVVLLDSLNGHYFSLDRVGMRMLNLALSEIDASTVKEKLLVQYDASGDQLAEDFGALMSELQTVGLVERDY
mgnify:CR=1 FL=1